MHELNCCRNVPVDWFRADEPPRWQDHYASLIGPSSGEYDNHPRYLEHWTELSRGAVEQLFTLDEAPALKVYLDQLYAEHGATKIEEVSLPRPFQSAGFGPLYSSYGGRTSECGINRFRLSLADGYPFSFEIKGYSDAYGCDLADGSGKWGMAA
jgi:hypothetical protein